MRRLILTLPLLTGCVFPGTDARIEYDPATGLVNAKLDRDWLAGPVDMTAELTTPTGGHAAITWKSDVNLDPAVSAQTALAATTQSTIQMLQQVVGAYLATQVPALPAATPPAAPAPPVVAPEPKPEEVVAEPVAPATEAESVEEGTDG